MTDTINDLFVEYLKDYLNANNPLATSSTKNSWISSIDNKAVNCYKSLIAEAIAIGACVMKAELQSDGFYGHYNCIICTRTEKYYFSINDVYTPDPNVANDDICTVYCIHEPMFWDDGITFEEAVAEYNSKISL